MMRIKKETLILILIGILGFSLRIWGINFGLPSQFHQDEPMAINHAISYGGGDFNPHYFQLPPFMSYILFFLYAIFYIVGTFFGIFINTDSFLTLFLQNPTPFYLIARISMGLIPGCLSIVAIYKLTAIISDKKTALISAFFLAVSFLHVRDSHYAYHDVPLAFFLILAFIFLFKYFETFRLKNIIIAGILTGLATGFKYNAIIIIIPALLMPWLHGRHKVLIDTQKSPAFRTLPLKVLGRSILMDRPRMNANRLKFYLNFLGMLFISYFLSNPYSVLDFKTFFHSFLSEKSAHNYIGWLYHIKYSAFEGMGIFITIISLAGFLYFLFSKDYRKNTLAIFVLFSYLSIVYFGQLHERYILPILPFLLIMGSVCLRDFLERLFSGRTMQNIFLVIAILSLNFMPIVKSIYSDILFSRPDSRTQAAQWILNNISAGQVIALDHPFFSPKLMQDVEQIDQKLNLLGSKKDNEARIKKAQILRELSQGVKSYKVFFLSEKKEDKFIFSSFPSISFNVEELLGNKVHYVVLHLDYPAQKYPKDVFKGNLSEGTKLVKLFDPFKRDKFDLKANISTTAAAFRTEEIFARTNNGPVLFVYELY